MKHRIIYIVMLFTLFGCKEMVECGDGILMTGTASNNLVKFPIDEQDMYTISVTSTACVESDVKVHIAIDTDLVEEYNRDMGTIFYPVPDEVCTLDNSDVVISAGQAVSSAATISILADKRDLLVEGRSYLLPVTILHVDAGLPVIESGRTIFLKLSKSVYFSAPYVGTTNTTKKFEFDNPAEPMTQYTWELKFKAENFKRNSANEPIRIGSWYNNMLRFGEGGASTNILEVYAGTEKKLIANTQFTPGVWYMLSVVNDGRTLTLYVNGEKDNSRTVSTDEYVFSYYDVGMTESLYQSRQLFHGWCGGIRIWSGALSQREIKNNLCSVDPDAVGLEAYWPMNEGSGDVFRDMSPNQRHLVYEKEGVVEWTEVNNKCVE